MKRSFLSVASILNVAFIKTSSPTLPDRNPSWQAKSLSFFSPLFRVAFLRLHAAYLKAELSKEDTAINPVILRERQRVEDLWFRFEPFVSKDDSPTQSATQMLPRSNYFSYSELLPKGMEVLAPKASTFKGQMITLKDDKVVNKQKQKIVLYIHGGAFLVGSSATHSDLTRRLCESCGPGVSLLSIDYGLAPEHPFPAALHDSLSAYKWLLDEGYNPKNIVIAGESAGGNLAAAVVVALIHLRGQGHQSLPFPGGVVCLAPWLDLAYSYSKDREAELLEEKDYLPRELLTWAAEFYAPPSHGKDFFQWALASPFHAHSHILKEFPPIFLQIGSHDLLLPQTLRFAENVKTQPGSKLTLSVLSGLPHAFQLFGWFLPEAQLAILETAHWIRNLDEK